MPKVRVTKSGAARKLKAGDAVSNRKLKVTRNTDMQYGSSPKDLGKSWTGKSAVRTVRKKK